MSKADTVRRLFTPPLRNGEVAFIYLGYSGVVFRTSKQAVIVDPADLLKDDEMRELRDVHLLLFTHGHGDHYKPDTALGIFRSTGAPILAESGVANDLRGKIPSDKLIAASPKKAYTFGEIHVDVVQGIHRGPIDLYRISVGGLRVFHAGDSGYVPVRDYPSDLVFLPTGSPSPTASPEYALKMALELKPSVAVAIHGSKEQSREFEAKMRDKMPNTSVMVAEPYVATTLTIAKR